MPSEVNVSADPLVVYAMVGLVIGALVLALIFAWPRRGLGAATKADAAQTPPDEAWMPGGDIFGREEPATQPAEELPTYPTYPTYPTFPESTPGLVPPAPPAAHDPWSTATTEQHAEQPRWDKP
jgi:hypothetical protein